MKSFRHVVPAAALSLLLGACSNTPQEAKYPADMAPPVSPSSSSRSSADAAADAARRAAAERDAAARAAAAARAGDEQVAERVIYFGFDDSTIDAQQSNLLSRHARVLTAAPNLPVRIEGHTDERGSAEYNLALGQRRADAVRRSLSLLGVADARMEAISWGEQKPVALGHDESAWAQNRRAELIYSAR